LILCPARDRHLFAPREPGRILVELDDQPRLIVFDISALRFRPAEILELHELAFRCAEFFQNFQFRANFFRDAPAFAMSGRDDEGGLVILDRLQIIGGEHLVAFIGGDFQDRAELFQTGKAPLDIAMTQSLDGFPIRRVKLAANLFYLHGLQSGVTFQQPERVASFDGAVLRGVTGENNAAVLFLRQLRDLFELRHGQQPGLINQQNAVADSSVTSRRPRRPWNVSDQSPAVIGFGALVEQPDKPTPKIRARTRISFCCISI
jgi:hypothetical protein